jgi:hypothetical protein
MDSLSFHAAPAPKMNNDAQAQINAYYEDQDRRRACWRGANDAAFQRCIRK